MRMLHIVVSNFIHIASSFIETTTVLISNDVVMFVSFRI